jgi:hypothetical protein
MGYNIKMDLNELKKNTIQFFIQHIKEDRILLFLYCFYMEKIDIFKYSAM